MVEHGASSHVFADPRPGPDILYAPPVDSPQLRNSGPWRAQPILVSGAGSYRDGEFGRDNPLVLLPWTQWLTWGFQVVPVFFAVAGYASAVSWSRRDFVVPDDIRAVAKPALRHRIILNFEGEAEGITTEAVIRAILDSVAPPAVE